METVEEEKAEIEAEEKVEVETEEFDVGERDIGLTYDSIEEKFMAISELGLVQCEFSLSSFSNLSYS